jgi:hypothetical protein
MSTYYNLTTAINLTRDKLFSMGTITPTEKWQGKEVNRDMLELLDVHVKVLEVPNTSLELAELIQPNLPWADIHFVERVGGKPLNPGESYKQWPFYGQDSAMRSVSQKFSHTYMERYWPKKAGISPGTLESSFLNKGIRYSYGDLLDVIELLKKEPSTRQAYLPIWFPEDTGVTFGGRVPCTLGYHFIIRDGLINVTYYLRSCDVLRHMQDDIYLTCLLLNYVKDALSEVMPELKNGYYSMHIVSLHCFAIEKNKLKARLKSPA